ncbi:MAG: hypothetical protein Q9174_002096 [Haloplaca sp. 1 TL-2023]
MIEEALKLYQTALKLHSQGPDSYDEAETAYKALFGSEIFTYFESLSEAQRLETYGDDSDDLLAYGELHTVEAVPAVPNIDGSASTLPQILYLSYKNYGQFILDRLKYQISVNSRTSHSSDSISRDAKPHSKTIASSLELLVEAVNRDDTDGELWRQLSRIGASLGSQRIARFCLEAVLEKDLAPPKAWSERLGLQELFATKMLDRLLELIEDESSQATTTALTRKQSKLLASFKGHLDPLPYLPTPPPDPLGTYLTDQKGFDTALKIEVEVHLKNWAGCGKAILLQLQKQSQGLASIHPNERYVLVLPSSSSTAHQSEAHRLADAGRESQALRADQDILSDGNIDGISASVPLDGASNDIQQLSQKTGMHSDVPIDPTALAPSADALPNADVHDPTNEIATGVETRQDLAGEDDHGVAGARTITLPTRKRSNGAAELDEGDEETGRARSKRIKAKASLEEQSVRKDPLAKQLEQWQQGEFRYLDHIDEQAFDHIAALMARLGVTAVASVRDLKANVLSLVGPQADKAEAGKQSTGEPSMLKDLAVSLGAWNTHLSSTFLHGTGFDDPISGPSVTRMSDFLASFDKSTADPQGASSNIPLLLDQDLGAFVHQEWISLDEMALQWIERLLARTPLSRNGGDTTKLTAYEAFIWPDNLKETVVQLLINRDEYIYERVSRMIMSPIESQSVCRNDCVEESHPLFLMVQNIFELHLDVYGRITNPRSIADTATKTAQSDRLQRWALLAHWCMNSRTGVDEVEDSKDQDSIRFLWSHAVYADLSNMCSRELIVSYFQDLQSTLQRLGRPVIGLHNNAIIPEISIEAAGRQLSRLMTMDFFVNVFGPDNDDPVALVENLEPILERSMKRQQFPSTPGAFSDPDEGPDNSAMADPEEPYVEQTLQFLDNASLSMRLLLWRKLIDAYSVIEYSPRILLCYLRCIGLIVDFLQSPHYLSQGEGLRQTSLFRWLKSLDDLLRLSLSSALTNSKSLDCMDEVNLRDAMSDLGALQHVLHTFVAWDDLIRTGLRDTPKQPNNSANLAYSNAMDKFRDMIIKTWTLQYVLLRDYAAQTSVNTLLPNRDLVLYLKLTHKALGSRNYCKMSNKVLVRLIKEELIRIDTFADSELESAQLILDLYGLTICPGSKEVDDHGCPAENLDRQAAVEMVDRVLVQAHRMNVKDLIKSELRNTIEKMQQVIKIPKTTASVIRNKDTLDGFLHSPINPLRLYRALRGLGELPCQKLHGEAFQIAEKGWYFLQGYIALSKFRAQKKAVPGMIQDLDTAERFFRHDLEQGFEKWETWYRLAQVHDARIEEYTTWSSEKLNDSMPELVNLQRNAIHCYTMAVATAERSVEATFDMFQKMADLYSDFAVRLYGSSREPFSMEAFGVEAFVRHFNGERRGMYQDVPFKPLGLYAAWRLATTLLRRSLVHKPENWMTWYMLGKCLWKMHNCDDAIRLGSTREGFQPVLDAFKMAIQHLPGQKDNRHPEKDPILEPHYKLVSIIHKLVFSERLGVEAGCEAMSLTPYGRKIPPVQDFDDWEGYILQVLKALRSADKANWYHRMVVRAARTLFDGSPNDPIALRAAKSELTQQIFTKTMTIQVWKPELERPGRHFVYTRRYSHFFLKLLHDLKERAGIEALGRKIRRKAGDFFKHGSLWQETCMAHLSLLRQYCLVPTELADSVWKNISHDLFVHNADRLEAWAHLPSTESPMINVLREAIELKKTNGNLMKPQLIEDLIADVYAHLHQTMVPELILRSNEEESRGRMRVDHLMNVETAVVSTPSPDPTSKAEDAAPVRQRVRGVGRREIQKRAEVLINKPASAQTTTKAPKTPPPANGPATPRSTVQVIIKQNDGSKDGSSVPGSIHDSADDESELSDVEEAFETAPTRPMFPNLADTEEGDDDEGEGFDQDSEIIEEEEAEVKTEESASEGLQHAEGGNEAAENEREDDDDQGGVEERKSRLYNKKMNSINEPHNSMKRLPMSSTTEESDWEAKSKPQSRRPSSNGLGNSNPRRQPKPPPQHILPRSDGPGQSVFPVVTPSIPTHDPFANTWGPPQPHFQFVNQGPLPAPAFTAPPVSPALTRVIHDNGPMPIPPPIINPLPQVIPQAPAPPPALTPMEVAPQQYTTPPSRSIRGVKAGGARRARGATRKPRIKVETPDTNSASLLATTPASSTRGSGRGRGRGRGGTRGNKGGRPRGSRAGASSSLGIKRKREDDDEKDDSDVSEIITPLPTQSRSGRKITHANPIVIDLEEKVVATPSTAAAKPSVSFSSRVESKDAAPGGRGKKRFSRPAESSVCKNCGRGHSPASNMIVFCDGCNGPWHQHCHDPPISPEIIRIEDSQWFCADCVILREEKAVVEGKLFPAPGLLRSCLLIIKNPL